MSTLTFWPEDLVSDLPVSPVTILKQAGAELGEATKGAIEVEVKNDARIARSDEVEYDFTLVAKAMSFRYVLLSVNFNPTGLYPCDLIYDGEVTQAENDADFRNKLTDLLRSRDVVTTVKALLSQSQ